MKGPPAQAEVDSRMALPLDFEEVSLLGQAVQAGPTRQATGSAVG